VRWSLRRGETTWGLIFSRLATSLPVAQWSEHPKGVREVIGSIPVELGTQIFSLSHAHDKLNIPYFSFLSKLKIYHLSFFIITHGALDIADPSSM